jgi:hypothetical protein
MKKDMLFDFEKDALKELPLQIAELLKKNNSSSDYRNFTVRIFKEILNVKEDDPVWNLFSYIDSQTDFWTGPASTHFHGAEECGLIRHSLLVVAKCLLFAPVMLDKAPDYYYLISAALFHDFCKVNMYEIKTRNVKNQSTGKWETAPFYSVRPDYLAFGHGIESVLRLNEFIKMPNSWNHAIRWHMGAFDVSESDKMQLNKATTFYNEVLLLHTADMQAGIVEKI